MTSTKRTQQVYAALEQVDLIRSGLSVAELSPHLPKLDDASIYLALTALVEEGRVVKRLDTVTSRDGRKRTIGFYRIA